MKYILSTIALTIFMATSTGLFGQHKGMTISTRIVGKLEPGVAGAVIGSHGAHLLVAGGADFPDGPPWKGGAKAYHDRVRVFEKNGDRLVENPASAALPEKVAYAASCSTPQGVFYAGGENGAGISDKVYLLRWDDSSASIAIDTLPPLPVPLTNASAAFCDRRVYIAGGESPKGPSDQCWTIDLGDLEGGWSPLPPLPKPVSHAVLTAIEREYAIVLHLLGGRCKKPDGISELYDSVYELSPSEGRWVNRPALPYPISAGTGIALGTKGALLFGGDRGGTFTKVEKLLTSIATSTVEAEKQRLINEKNELQAGHPGFDRKVIFYDFTSGKSKTIGKLTQDAPVTTTAVAWEDAFYIPSGEIRAGVRTPAILRIDLAKKGG